MNVTELVEDFRSTVEETCDYDNYDIDNRYGIDSDEYTGVEVSISVKKEYVAIDELLNDLRNHSDHVAENIGVHPTSEGYTVVIFIINPVLDASGYATVDDMKNVYEE